MKKAVLVLSGGLDSCVLLYSMLDQYSISEITCLSFDYGAKHSYRELKSAAKIVDTCGADHHVIKLPFIRDLFNSALLSSSAAIPKGEYTKESLAQTIVPFRNGIMLSIAAGFAESIMAEHVYYGAHYDDGATYPDCTTTFMLGMRKAIYEGTSNNVMMHGTFGDLCKSDIVKIGDELGVPFGHTYSCYEGGPMHCGECSTCCARKEAFLQSRVFDPTEYLV